MPIILAVGAPIGLPLLLLPEGEWTSYPIGNRITYIVLSVAVAGLIVWLEWPEIESVIGLRRDKNQKFDVLMSATNRLIKNSIRAYRKSQKNRLGDMDDPTIRLALVVVIHTNWGFRKKMMVVRASDGLAELRVFSQSDLLCGRCWKEAYPICWSDSDAANSAQNGGFGERPGACVPIWGNNKRIRGVLYVDLSQEIADTGLHERILLAPLENTASVIFDAEIPEYCFRGRA
jgi:hypothetical protein